MIWVKEWLQILVTTYVRVLCNIYDYFTIYEWFYLFPVVFLHTKCSDALLAEHRICV